MTSEVAAYPKLKKIKAELDSQNPIIFQAEQQQGNLEIELSDLKGIENITKKGELQRRIDEKTDYISRLKIGFSNIICDCKYGNINEFLLTFKECRTAYVNYQQEVDNWQKAYDNPETVSDKLETLTEKLARLQKEVEGSQRYNNRQTKDRGGR